MHIRSAGVLGLCRKFAIEEIQTLHHRYVHYAVYMMWNGLVNGHQNLDQTLT